ncbi:MAG: hypothetical protein JWQ38_506 [Flavipsychrobacter sp.]|nr:hypothetical protein [Flavipsychrobacter sp.]
MKKAVLLQLMSLVVAFSAPSYAQIITTFAGSGGIASFSGDGGPATAAHLNTPQGMAIDATGNIYIADTKNHCIRKITSGIISTIAGTGGVLGYSGDGGSATSAKMNEPVSVYVDGSGNIYAADASNHVVRKITAAGIISTIAGNGIAGYSADGIAATNSKLNFPGGVWVDASGNVYIGDTYNQRVRKVNTSGIISTYAGTGTIGSSGDGGPATNALLYNTNEVTMDAAGNLYMSDNGNHRIRKVNTSGIISTVAGDGTGGYVTDGVPATSTGIYFPVGVKTDPSGNLYFGEDGDSRVRKVDATGIISTICGTGVPGYTGDGGAATLAQLSSPTDVCLDGAGNIYIVDRKNSAIRRIGGTGNTAPHFIGTTSQNLSVCENSPAVSIDTQMSITDPNSGQTETWTLLLAPVNGTAVVAYTATSTGSAIIPTGLTYKPNPGYAGADIFKVVVDDGTDTDTTTIHVTIDTLPTAGVISGIDSVCPGASVTLSETEPGGIWSCSDMYISPVTHGGKVTGMTPGTDTIIYTIINTCGIVSAIFPFTVRSYTACHTGFTNTQLTNEGVNVYPNPNSGSFTLNIQSAGEKQATVSIQNVLGVRVHETTIPCNQPADLNLNLPPGMYLLTAATTNQQWSKKIVINTGR